MKPVNFSKDESKQFWLVSVPNSEVGPHGFDQLRSAVGGAGVVAKFKIPSLRVGSLDSLLALSEDLGRKDQFFEGVVNKIARQLRDLYTDPETGSNEGPSAGDRILAVNNGTSTPQELPFCAFLPPATQIQSIWANCNSLDFACCFLPPSAQASHNNHVWGLTVQLVWIPTFRRLSGMRPSTSSPARSRTSSTPSPPYVSPLPTPLLQRVASRYGLRHARLRVRVN
jgi:hypothetical protein